jgi:hypothetical protein
LTIPPSALAQDQTLLITSTPDRPPAAFTSWSSPVYRFEPAGLTFAIPATVRINFTAASGPQSIYWTRADGTGFESIGGTVVDGAMETPVVHFSLGLVAAAPGALPRDAGIDGMTTIDAAAPDGPSVDAASGSAVDAALDASIDASGCTALGQLCTSPSQCCSANCVNSMCASAPNCMGAGQSCGSGSQCCSTNCAAGVCAACPAGLTLCGSSCVNTSTDPVHCGQCFHACPTGLACFTGTCGAAL